MAKYLAILSSLLTIPNLLACSFCGGNPAGRSTLREEYQLAHAVVFGTLKNPQLAFAFKHVEAGDETVSDDALLEFAKASDGEILKAKAHLDANKLKLMLKNPKTPAFRLGVYAVLLGLCGEKADAAVLAGMLAG